MDITPKEYVNNINYHILSSSKHLAGNQNKSYKNKSFQRNYTVGNHMPKKQFKTLSVKKLMEKLGKYPIINDVDIKYIRQENGHFSMILGNQIVREEQDFKGHGQNAFHYSTYNKSSNSGSIPPTNRQHARSNT